MKTIVSPSMLSADFADLKNELKKVESSGADWLHVDVMDGNFVPNITIGPDQVADLRKTVTLPFDVHLMVHHPLQYIERFARAGADILTVHYESRDDTDACVDLIRQCGIRPGVVLSPDTETEVLKRYIDRIDMVLLMSVYPGFGGQSYIKKSTRRIREVREMIGDKPVRLQIDGGINFDTLPVVLAAGVDTVVSGSCLFKGDMQANMRRFREMIAQYE